MDQTDLCELELRSFAPFRNAEWLVTEEGLVHRETGYDIAREGLDRRRAESLWDWPLHMAEKGWCTPSLFREAFLAALDRYGIERDAGLSESFALGFGIRAGRSAAVEAGFAMLGDLVRPRKPERRRRPFSAAEVAARRTLPSAGRAMAGA